MITFILLMFTQFPTLVYVGIGVAEVACVTLWIGWKCESKDSPKMHYRAFRRIERMAPKKWRPYQRRICETWSIGAVEYRTSYDWDRVDMKTFPEALLCQLTYIIGYKWRAAKKQECETMERYLKCWKEDVKAYQEKAELQAKKAAKENMELVKETSAPMPPFAGRRLIEEIRSDGSVLVYYSGDRDGGSVIDHRNRYWSEDDTWDE